MKVLILGSGVIGVTTAYYLARAGHEVTVVDRQAEPALETSFANAGEVSPGYSSPWAGPGVPVKAIKWLLMQHGPLVIRPKLDPVMWWWLLKMLRNCTAERYAINKSRMIPIAEYSRDCLRALRAETGITYDERSQGTLQLFRKQKQLDGTGDDIAVLKQYGVPYEVLDPRRLHRRRAGARRREGQDSSAGFGCRRTRPATATCSRRRSPRRPRSSACSSASTPASTAWSRTARRITGVATSAGLLQADAYVVALGSWSPRLLQAARHSDSGLSGEGLFDHRADHRCRRRAGIDRDGRELQGRDHAARRPHPRRRHRGNLRLFRSSLDAARRATLDHSLTDLFPRGGDLGKATFWSGLRPMTPDGPPVIGATRYANLHLNTGHGTLGWTMACGSGRVLADLLSGRKPEIDVSELTMSRLRSPFRVRESRATSSRTTRGNSHTGRACRSRCCRTSSR